MIKLLGILVVLSVVVSLGACGRKTSAASSNLETRAKDFVALMAKGDFQSAVADFDPTMKSVMPPQKLEQTWKSVTDQIGAYQQALGVKSEKVAGFDTVIVTTQFEKDRAGIKVVFNKEGQISGLWFVPAEAAADYSAPSYAKPSSFTEKDIKVGNGKYALSGTLTLPNGKGPFAGVVLVHGSGPNDRDESIGSNKPFKDLSWGLASKGIAVLRYEKRTKEHPEQMAQIKNRITVKEETVDDAIAAASLLRKTDGINPKKVFIMGHSLGGMLAPRIAKADPDIAGLIIMAGSTRPLEDVIIEQMNYLLSLKVELSKEDKAEITKMKAQVDRIRSESLLKSTPASELILGVPAAYWLDLKSYDPAKTAKGLKQPMLILQGGRDYQVTVKDYEGWQKSLASNKKVAFKLYPDLNHLFITGKDKSTPAEYSLPGHVAEKVVDDIAGWIKTK